MSDLTPELLEEKFKGHQLWLEEKFRGVDDHFSRLNGRVAKVEARVEAHDRDLTRIKTLWTGAVAFIGPLLYYAVEAIKELFRGGGRG